MKKQLFIIMLFATVFICADFQRGNQLGQDITSVDTGRDLLGSAFGMVSGAIEETGERLTGDNIEHIQREERQPSPRKIRKINGTYRQIK